MHNGLDEGKHQVRKRQANTASPCRIAHSIAIGAGALLMRWRFDCCKCGRQRGGNAARCLFGHQRSHANQRTQGLHLNPSAAAAQCSTDAAHKQHLRHHAGPQRVVDGGVGSRLPG